MLISFHLLRPWSLDADLQVRDAYRSIVVPDRYLNGHRHPPDQLPFVPTKNTSPTSHQTRTGHGTGPPVGPPVLRSSGRSSMNAELHGTCLGLLLGVDLAMAPSQTLTEPPPPSAWRVVPYSEEMNG